MTYDKARDSIIVMTQTEAIIALKSLNGKLTQEKIAHEVGVSVSTVNRWINGKWKPIKYLLPDIERVCTSNK